MSLYEYLASRSCVVEGCDWEGGKVLWLLEGRLGVPMCRGHRIELANTSRERFELAHGCDFAQVAAAYREAYRQQGTGDHAA